MSAPRATQHEMTVGWASPFARLLVPPPSTRFIVSSPDPLDSRRSLRPSPAPLFYTSQSPSRPRSFPHAFPFFFLTRDMADLALDDRRLKVRVTEALKDDDHFPMALLKKSDSIRTSLGHFAVWRQFAIEVAAVSPYRWIWGKRSALTPLELAQEVRAPLILGISTQDLSNPSYLYLGQVGLTIC
eukprot:COSAG06_NODE_1491_length_9280_cov_2.615075_8_plen_185_part_00